MVVGGTPIPGQGVPHPCVGVPPPILTWTWPGGYPPPEQTHTCENITSRLTTYAGGNDWIKPLSDTAHSPVQNVLFTEHFRRCCRKPVHHGRLPQSGGYDSERLSCWDHHQEGTHQVTCCFKSTKDNLLYKITKLYLPTTYVVRGKVMFSVVSVRLFTGRVPIPWGQAGPPSSGGKKERDEGRWAWSARPLLEGFVI